MAATPDVDQLLESLRNPNAQIPNGNNDTRLGYHFTVAGANGVALLSNKNSGVDLIYRLKDTRPLLLNEIRFWAGLIAKLVLPDATLITHAPSSGKVPAEEHLATLLAQEVAICVSKPFVSVFVNNHPRCNRGSRETKLTELYNNPFGYCGPQVGEHLAVIDDVVYTRSTARRCVAAAGFNACSFAVLYLA